MTKAEALEQIIAMLREMVADCRDRRAVDPGQEITDATP